MTILLTGGGSGGHITPLLAVARELKQLEPDVTLVAVCETGSKFVHLFEEEPAIDLVRQVRAGKYRRYAGLTRLQRMLAVGTMAKNARDLGRVVRGYTEARKLLRQVKPDGILIKGGFVGVPVGLAAAHMHIPFITHDSDTTPGLANRIISRWASLHATGMPADFYTYPKEQTVYTGVPVSQDFSHVSSAQAKAFREEIGLKSCTQVLTVIGGSQGGLQLNEDIVAISGRLMQHYPHLGIAHIVGQAHEVAARRQYADELLADERKRVVVKGFVSDVYRYTGAADVVVSRASATVMAELAVQGKATIVVPGQLADDHQSENARHMAESGRVVMVPHAEREGLYDALSALFGDTKRRMHLAKELEAMAKPEAAKELAALLLKQFKGGGTRGA